MQLPPPFNRRFGRFRIGFEFMTLYPERVAELLSRCVVVSAETKLQHNGIEYVALCPLFQDVALGCECPQYEVLARLSYQNNVIRCRQPWEFRFASFENTLSPGQVIVG